MSDSESMTVAVVLPGMDGTGTLLHEFETAVASHMRPIVVRYPPDRALDYDELTTIAAASIPLDAPFLLIAESFSGPIAIRLAARHPEHLVGIVFCASFGRTPWTPSMPMPARLRRFVTRLTPLRLMPDALISGLMMGKWSTPMWRARITTALRIVSPQVIRHRLQIVLSVDDLLLLFAIRVPVLYLQAGRDALVSNRSAKEISARVADARVEEIEAPHFILQAAPETCAETIAAWLRRKHDDLRPS